MIRPGNFKTGRMMKKQHLQILHFEDNPADAILVREILSEVTNIICTVHNVDRMEEGLQQLSGKNYDLILLDLKLPDSSGFATFATVKNAADHVPVIIMSGLADENLAVKAVQEGAQDYLIKGQFEANLLIRAILYAIERQKLIVKLQDALEEIKTLQGFLPICAHCKDIRDDEGYWHQIEDYIHTHSEAEFSHSICPECAEKFYSQWIDPQEMKKKIHKKNEGA